MTDQGVRGLSETVVEDLRGARALSTLVGESPPFVRAIQCIPRLAGSDAAIVISGETGTGKELVARALHYAGPRAPHPFIPVNCGSLPDTLLEDELFGHERGAFTDAKASRTGLLRQADRGTLFLDEVDSLTPRAQVALLRVLQDKTYRSLGSAREQVADVRLVAATNTPLRTLVRTGAFRSDLFYRLSVLMVELPPLRHRPEDILILARHFLIKHSPSTAPVRTLSLAAEQALLAYDWPGNVRELENVMIRTQTLAVHSCITLEDIPLTEGQPVGTASPVDRMDGAGPRLRPFQEAKRSVVDAFEYHYLTQLLRSHGGNVSSAARAARKERRDFRRLLKKHGLDPHRFAALGGGMGDPAPSWGAEAPDQGSSA